MAASADPAGDDLGALLSRLLDEVVTREAPLLEARDVTMWEYVILTALRDGDGMSQKELASRSRRDSTRLIGHLDALHERGLIVRDVDPADRRRHLVRLTQRGADLVAATRRDVRGMEERLLAGLPHADREALRRSLAAVLDARHGAP